MFNYKNLIMDIVAKINDDNSFGGNFYTKDVKDNWNTTSVIYDAQYLKPIWNNSIWIEGATQEEIDDFNKPIIPEEISKMALSLELLDRGITDQDIFDDIDSIPDSMFPQIEKQKAKVKYMTAARFQRYNADLNLVATMEGLSQEDVNQIFINGKSR